MALAPQVVRQRIAAALAAVSGWAEFSGVPSRFPAFAARPISHKHFAVDLGAVDLSDDRQKTPGIPVSEEAIVTWSYLLRASDGRDDYDLALTEEVKLATAIRGVTGTEGPVCKITGIQRATLSDGTYMLGTITVSAWHTYPLA